MDLMHGHNVKHTMFLAPLTEEELNAVTVVFHQYETGLREGCIFTKVLLNTKYVKMQILCRTQMTSLNTKCQ